MVKKTSFSSYFIFHLICRTTVHTPFTAFTAFKERSHAKSLISSASHTSSQHAAREITVRPGERGIALGEFVAMLKRSFWGHCRETEAKLAKSGDGFRPKARVKPTLLKSLSWPTNLVRSLGKFATFSVSVGSDSRRAYPPYVLCMYPSPVSKLVGHGSRGDLANARWSSYQPLNNICC